MQFVDWQSAQHKLQVMQRSVQIVLRELWTCNFGMICMTIVMSTQLLATFQNMVLSVVIFPIITGIWLSKQQQHMCSDYWLSCLVIWGSHFKENGTTVQDHTMKNNPKTTMGKVLVQNSKLCMHAAHLHVHVMNTSLLMYKSYGLNIYLKCVVLSYSTVVESVLCWYLHCAAASSSNGV